MGHGIKVGHQAVEMLMRRASLQGLSGRPKYRKVPNMPTASDLVDRDFQRSEPDRLWVTDITEHPTREGKVYCAVVLDTFSRRVVGWSIDARPTAALVTNALGMAIDNRQPVQGETIIHSDHGTQYTSWAFTQRAVDSGLVPSMGSIGDCFDNAVIESFWSRMQVELFDTRRWKTPHRTGQRHLRAPRDLAQSTAASLITRDDDTHRVRDSTSRNNSSMNPESCLRETQGTPLPGSGGRSRRSLELRRADRASITRHGAQLDSDASARDVVRVGGT